MKTACAFCNNYSCTTSPYIHGNAAAIINICTYCFTYLNFSGLTTTEYVLKNIHLLDQATIDDLAKLDPLNFAGYKSRRVSITNTRPGSILFDPPLAEITSGYSVDLIQGSQDLQPSKIVCECGAKKVGAQDYGPGHSHWCPVAEKLGEN